MQQSRPKITLPKYPFSESRSWLRGQCPSCLSTDDIYPVNDEETYVDDEEAVYANGLPAFYPYKDYTCAYCGAEWRVYLGPVAVHITKEEDIDINTD